MAAKPYLEQGVEPYSFGRRDGVVAFTYYSGHFIKDLVSQEELSEARELDWSVTDIIPKFSFEAVEKDKPILVIVGEKSFEDLQKKLPGKWTLLEKGRRNNLYYRAAD